MKKWILLFCTGWLNAFTLPAADSWDLRQCIGYALEHNHDLKIQQWNVESQQTRLVEAYTAFLPSLSAQSGVNFSFGRSVDPETNTYGTVSNLNNSYSASLSVPLFTGGNLIHQFKLTRLQLAQGKSQTEARRDNMVLNLMELYIQASYYQELASYTESKLDESRIQVKKVHRLKELGLKSKTDVALIEAQYAADDYNHAHTLHLLDNALLALKKEMAYPVTEELHIASADWHVTVPLVPSEPFQDEIAHTYRVAEARLPEMRQSRLAVDASLYGKRQALSRFFPDISFSAGMSSSYFRTLGKADFIPYARQLRNNWGQYLSFNISFPLFNRLGNAMNYKRSKIAYRSAQEEYAQRQDELWADVQQAILDRESLRKEYLHMEQKVKADSIAYAVIARKFDEGMAAPLDLRTASNTLLSSRATLLQCKLNHLLKCRLVSYYQGEPLY